ncbi:unnamed protein product [Meloidogyne enterolobii]|uniref:Uncharacterized protein n=1 Tax=Meloidogyne enterolobii TaxID=390850 RepID=A0ACB0ZTC9_MELEN
MHIFYIFRPFREYLHIAAYFEKYCIWCIFGLFLSAYVAHIRRLCSTQLITLKYIVHLNYCGRYYFSITYPIFLY